MKRNTAICFDLDGTLVDSNEAHVQSYNMAFNKNNLPAKTSLELVSKFGPPAHVLVKELFPNISDRKLPQVVRDKIVFFREKTCKLVTPIAGVAEALERLKKNFRLVLVSNATKDEILASLKQVKIKPKLFDAILGREDIGQKLDPQAMKKAEKAVKCKIEFVVGDTVYDIQMGKAAGIKTVAVLTGVHDIKKLGGKEPTMIIKSAALLPEILEGEL